MNTLLKAAQDVIKRWDSPQWSWDVHTGVYIVALRQALADHIPDSGKKVYVPMSKEEHLAIAMQCMGADNWQQEAMEAVEAETVRRMKEQGLV